MPVPRIVEEMAARAEALRQQIYENGGQPAATAPTPAPEPAPAPAPEPAPAPAPAAPAPGPVAQPPVSSPTPAPAPSSSADEQKLEHRYSVLQGKYNAEVPRLNARAEEAERKAQEAQAEAQRLREQLAAKGPEKLVTEKEVEEFGEGMVEMVRKAAREELQSRDATIATLQAQLQQLQTGVQQTTQLLELGFYETLGRDHPDWAVVNDDPAFHRWLDEVDPLLGARRQDTLNSAVQAQDGRRASAFFAAFKRTRGSQEAAAAAALSTQVAPPPGSNAPAPANPAANRVFTRQEVNDFYAKVRRGLVGAEEAAATERELHKAAAEGRIK